MDFDSADEEMSVETKLLVDRATESLDESVDSRNPIKVDPLVLTGESLTIFKVLKTCLLNVWENVDLEL
jgi:hypothetical protein